MSASGDPVSGFQAAMARLGIVPTQPIRADGELHRFAVEGDSAGSKNGYYVLHLDGQPAGMFGCFKRGVKATWKADGAELSQAERAALARKVDAERRRRAREEADRHHAVADDAEKWWETYRPASDGHPYLARKRVGAHGAKVDGQGRLVVPLRDLDGHLWSLQTIHATGAKMFLPGGRKRGCLHLIGEPGERFVVAEGFATGASIHEATGVCVAVAFDAGNLAPVAWAIRERWSGASIVVAADDDRETPGNPGLTAAEAAAQAAGATVAIPACREPDGRKLDFNDLAVTEGGQAVAEAILPAFRKPAGHAFAVHASEVEEEEPSGSDAAIAAMARLDELEYDRKRKAEARRLGVRVDTLDALVRKRRGGAPSETSGRALEWPTPEPWPKRVDGAELLDDLGAAFRRFVVLPAGCDAALALWVLHAHAFAASQITPRLALTSPERRCGKTTTLEIIQALTPRPLLAANLTAAAVFRTIELARPTLLIDEADTFLAAAEELRGVLNSGHRRTGEVIRTVGEDHEPRRFSTWAPVAIAAIGKLPGTLDDRSIKVELRRRMKGEEVERWRADRPGQFTPLVRRMVRWAQDHHGGLAAADPAVPALLHDRAADNWRPLLAIADAAGGEWPDRARRTAAALSAVGAAEGRREMLLADLKAIFDGAGGRDWLPTKTIIEELVAMEERPWSEHSRGKPINPSALRSLLEVFKVFSSSNGKARGYRRDAFADVWTRYLPGSGDTDPSTRQEANNGVGSDLCATRQSGNGADGSAWTTNPHEHWPVDGLTGRHPQDGEIVL
jgi:putative DNA primase/helicase